MPVVGTAGHVDHGKSTLVRALTGRDPDRWDEEKRRGLTIDLGFAWTTLPSGTDVGFVDVPGHERFIKNMLAGVDAIDVAVFAVAADEGWMPQSEEHLAVLDLLGISRGIVALTRADLVDADGLELAVLEVEERLAGTSLEGAPILPTSVPEGRGIDELLAAIDTALAGTVVPDLERPRMWIDRSFTIGGAGTVVTGTLVDGTIGVDDTLALFPGGTATRVRSIQSHEESVTTIGPGNRTAINLAGLDREEIARGAMLGRADQWAPTLRFTADLRTVRGLEAPLREQGAYHLHAGSGSWPARVRLLEGDRLEGAGAMMIDVGDPVPLKVGDRFILREVGRQAVVAGGRILDPNPPRRVREAGPMLPALRAAQGADEVATALLGARGVADLARLAAETGGGIPEAALVTEGRAYSARRIHDLVDRALRAVDAFHADNPLRPGMPKASLAERLRVAVDDLDAIVGTAENLLTDGPTVRSTSFSSGLDGEAGAAWERLQSELRATGFAPPRRKEIEIDHELMHALLRSGRLIAISDELVYLPETLDDVERRVRDMADGFTVADFRDAMGVSRKYAVPLLEWMDSRGVTRREGEGRVVRPPQPDER
jgi:selenocysteine-specific elongation factor